MAAADHREGIRRGENGGALAMVTVCLPALIRSGSTSSSRGNGPMPSNPFSDCSITSIPAGT